MRQLFTVKAGQERGYFGRGFERLGFIPGTQPGRPKPAGAAAPQRLDTQHHGERAARTSRGAAAPAVPSEEDLWRLTAAFQRPQRRASPADASKLRQLWRADPDPARTIAFHDEVLAAVRAGNVRQQGDECLRDCPWSQVYVAVNRVVIGGVQLERSEKFALQVDVKDGRFGRRICRLGTIKTAS